LLNFLAHRLPFYDVKRKEEIIAFLDTKIKSVEEDPDRKWITTTNDYLIDIKYFFRWLYNDKKKENKYTQKDKIASSLPYMKLHPLSESRRKRSLVRHTVSLVRNRTLLQNKVHTLLDKYHCKTKFTDRHIGKYGMSWLKFATTSNR
jgi:hypothetical protein